MIVGIDLGTTNSVVATLDDAGSVSVLRNGDGAETTPSVVYMEESGAVVVGDTARHLLAVDPLSGVRLVKRSMGVDSPMTLRGQQHTPESISALILRSLTAGLQGPVQAVVTVPAYFGLAEREATFQAGAIAGLEVLELLDEPVAAALHYGLAARGERSVLVYDLGGGTFDTTVLRIRDGSVTVLATDGDHSLGGADVDDRLHQIVLERLERLLGAEEYERFLDEDAVVSALQLDVEAAKKDLSSRTSRALVVRTPAGRTTVTLTRRDLDQACGDLVDTTAAIVDRLLAATGLRAVDDVVMVGGSSRLPPVAEALERRFGIRPQMHEPDLAVAKGAALRAHQLAGSRQLTTLMSGGPARAGQVRTVVPRAVGILVEDSFDPAGERRFVHHLLTANTPVPVQRREDGLGTIVDAQESVRIQVYEQAGSTQSREVAHNRRVLDGELVGLGQLPAGSVISIEVSVSADGRLTVTAREPVSGRRLVLEAAMDGVVDAQETQRLRSLVGMTVLA
jgi:molecular chaperone DnaK (HSP70)